MDHICFALPILPGKTDDARTFHRDLEGPRKADYVASEQRIGIVAECYRTGRAGKLMRAAEALTATGAVALLTRAARSRRAAALAGAALLGASACTRFGIFEAGLASARDPRYTVAPQRERMRDA